jgi:DNA helicase II / ATP-dependent DNA helicase PcrA
MRNFDQNSFTKSLNPEQAKAVLHLEGPLLILAGAGSGKTRVLTSRMAHIIAAGKAAPDEILAVTFTNKAAREMEHRIISLLRDLGIPVYERLWVSTFHSICARILRDNIKLLDFTSAFAIYDTSDQLSVVKKVAASLGYDEKIDPAKAFASRINSYKTEGLGIDELRKSRMSVDEKTMKVYIGYEEEMKRSNALDFGDLLLKTHDLFKCYPAVLEAYQGKFKYLLVDEYQDTNRIQYLLVQQLARASRNLCVVGDEDQSIYSWRGADISNIMDFEKDFPEALVVKLEQNYRSTQTIVNAATYLIKKNSQRKDKTLFTNNNAGAKICVREEQNEYDEAKYVVSDIAKILNQGTSANDISIFYRTNAQSRVLEEQLRMRSIPYRIVGGIKFYERMEIKDIIAYMRLLVNPADNVSFKRVVNTPARGIGKTTVENLEQWADERKMPLLLCLESALDARLLHAGATKKLRGFLQLIESLKTGLLTKSPSELYHDIIDQTEYVVRLEAEDTPEAQSRVENLEEFNNAILKFEEERGEEATLQSFLEEMALVSDADALPGPALTPRPPQPGQNGDTGADAKQNSSASTSGATPVSEKATGHEPAVTMMTLHISKGLEFPHVYIVGLEEGLFPSGRALDSKDKSEIEEERRLAYVGITRAREKLTLTYARTRRVWGTEQYNPPSRFIRELPEEMLDQQTSMQRPKFMDRYNQEISNQSGHRGRSTDAFPNYESSNDSFGDESFDEIASRQFDDTDSDSSSGDSSKPSGYAALQKGMRVRHPTFGVGSIYQSEGAGENLKVTVLFADQSIKKFIAKYARLERV